jgi:hypothetical protein
VIFRHFGDRGAMDDRTSIMAVEGEGGGDRPSRGAEQEVAFAANVGGRLSTLEIPMPASMGHGPALGVPSGKDRCAVPSSGGFQEEWQC